MRPYRLMLQPQFAGKFLFGTVNFKGEDPDRMTELLLHYENVDFYHSYYFLIGAEGTNKYVAPKIGFTLFGMLDLTGGYAFPIGTSGINGKELKGLNINFTLNIPTVFIHDMFK